VYVALSSDSRVRIELCVGQGKWRRSVFWEGLRSAVQSLPVAEQPSRDVDSVCDSVRRCTERGGCAFSESVTRFVFGASGLVELNVWARLNFLRQGVCALADLSVFFSPPPAHASRWVGCSCVCVCRGQCLLGIRDAVRVWSAWGFWN